MVQTDEIQYKKLDLHGVQTLVSLALAEGWNPGVHDAELFYNTDPDGFLGCFYHDEMIGGGSIVSYHGHYGFMGLFIMKPEYRNSGIGTILWNKRKEMLQSRLHPQAAIGMDGVVSMQAFYQKGGFEIAFRDERYENTGSAFEKDKHIISITSSDMDEVVKYDTSCFGLSRRQFIIPWFNQKDSYSFKYQKDNQLQGLAILRKCAQGYKIGPLFADAFSVAAALYKACLNQVPGENVYLDIPLNNPDAVQLVKSFEAKYVFECARMYCGQPPNVKANKIFGITSFELG
jgi:GNAT superfamily N-acetyltransferase